MAMRNSAKALEACLELFAGRVRVPLLFAVEAEGEVAALARAAHQRNLGVADHRCAAPFLRAPTVWFALSNVGE